MHTVLFNLAQG